MKAGALHTILADGVWTPSRAHKRENNSNGNCLLCGEERWSQSSMVGMQSTQQTIQLWLSQANTSKT
eukprot:5435767-Heterocapsa_arctica.AAC.1